MPDNSAPVLNVSDVVELEQRIAADGTTLAQLMRNAGKAVADEVSAMVPQPCGVCVLAGAGNNGGDGWVAAEFLAQAGYRVDVICPGAPESIKAQPAHDAAAHALAQSPSINVMSLPNNGKVTEALRRADVVVDALLGTGFSGIEVRPGISAWIDRANNIRATEGLKIVAVDVPSGLSAQTGRCAEPCIRADVTVTMMVLKPGLLSAEGKNVCGTTSVAAICDLAPYRDFIDRVKA